MFNKYYQQELQNLRELAVEFSKVHPSIAPLLSGPTSDPDVERLLEGVAFLTGLLRRKLHDDFPEIIHGLMNIIFPHYIRPIPSCSIVVFSPKPGMMETINVQKGVSLGAVPIEGTSCTFRTCFDLDVHPLRLISADIARQTGKPDVIRIVLETTGPDLSQWQPKKLSFFLGGSYSESTDLFMILTRYVRQIVVRPSEKGSPCVLPKDALKPVGFDTENCMLPFPSLSFSGYRLLQEYFLLPRKFLFFELHGWETWQERGKGKRFEILFELMPSPIAPPKVKSDNFILFGTPVVNLFPHEADPFLFDHRLEKIRIRPAGLDKRHYRVYSIDSVIGHTQGSLARKEYVPLERFQHGGDDHPIYQANYTRSPIDNSPEVYLSLTYPPTGGEPERETISVSMTCTNGELAERLRLGDICMPTSDSPELLSFRNVIPPTSTVDPPLGSNASWRFLSHLSLNYFSLADAENIKELLKLYAYPEGRDRAAVTANLKRIDGIANFQVSPTDRLLRGMMMRGQNLEMTSRHDHYAGLGDLFLFGAVMDLFFGVYSSMNTFTQFHLKDSLTGERFVWPVRMGDRPLI
ncbi:MAG: type VI secretion system baseplate subunit TssF [Syntrophobacterales bacterium]|nr:type VI secretion system baseplate subunit TssF [Syntrophobacterales bacterium]